MWLGAYSSPGTTTSPAVATVALPNATSGSAYSASLVAINTNGPVVWSATGLPSGLSFSPDGGISGTPVPVGNFSPTFTVKDSLNQTASATIPLSVLPAATVSGPQRIFAGVVSDISVTLQLWSPATGDPDGGFNFYRVDVTGALNGATPVQLVSPGNFRPVPQCVFTDTTVAPNTTYSYFGTAIIGGVESQPGPTIQVTTLAPGPGATLPAVATDPATYITPAPTSYVLGAGNSKWTATNLTNPNAPGTIDANGDLSQNCGPQYAFTNANAGDLIVLTGGATYSGTATWTLSASGTVANPIIVTTDQDPVLTSGGNLIAYSTVTQNFYTVFVLSASLPAAGATSMTLASVWAQRSGYFPTVLYTNSPPSFEQRLMHFVAGSATVTWEVGYTGGGPLIGAVTSSTILVHVGNYVTWDDVPVSLAMLHFSFGNPNGLDIQGSNIRLVGVACAPNPNQPASQVSTNILNMGPNVSNITLDRCLIGNDTGQLSWSACIRGVEASGSTIVAHQCSIIGIGFSFPSTLNPNTGQDCQGWYSQANGPHCVENCFIEALTENIFIGGGGYVGENNVTNNNTYRYNYLQKNGAWNGNEFGVYVKNLTESKTADTVAIYGNIYQNCWEAEGTAGQRGLGMNIGSIDQVASAPQRTLGTLTWASTNGGTVSGTGNFWGSGLAVGAKVTSTISNVRNAAYNGTFLMDITSISQDGSHSFQYSLPFASPGPGASQVDGTFIHGQIATTALMCTPWARVVNFDVHDNQFYGVSTAVDFHNDEGQQSTGHNGLHAFHNNVGWINPAGQGLSVTTVTLSAPPTGTVTSLTATAFTITRSTTPGWPFQQNAANNPLTLSTGQVINITNLGQNGTVITIPSTVITGTPTATATITIHSGKSRVSNIIVQPPCHNLTIDHNTFVMPPFPTGYMQPNQPLASICLQFFTVGNPIITNRRTIITNNVFDGTQGCTMLPGAAGINSSSGVTALNQSTTAVTFTNNAFSQFISDGTTGWPTPTFFPAASGQNLYTALYGTFAGNTVMPTAPGLLDVDQPPYSTDSTTGGAIGSSFPTAATTLNFPLTGAVLVGGSVDFINVANIAKINFALFACFPSYSAGGKTFAQQVAAVLAVNPTIKIQPQVNVMEVPSNQMVSGDAHFVRYTECNTSKWWLRTVYPGSQVNPTSGAVTDTDVVGSQAGAASINIATTNLTPNNDAILGVATHRQWHAAWVKTFTLNVTTGISGIHTDNWFPIPGGNPGKSGDYLQNGTTQTPAQAQTAWCNAYADWANQLRAILPVGGLVTGNVNDCGHTTTPPGGVATWLPTQYLQLLDGGILEGTIGQSFAFENTSWLAMMNAYKICMNMMRSPTYLIFNQQCTATQYAAARYGICSCLLDNGYYASNPDVFNVAQFFDELNFNLGSAIAGPNNPSNGTYSSGGLTVWKAQGPIGVWRRDFQNGIVLVNPRGNGAQTVTLEVNTWHLRQSIGNDNVNNATAVPAGTSITLPDPNTAGVGGSGLIMSRTAT